MINFKQKELCNELFNQLHLKYPELKLTNITQSPENPEDIWVHINYPEDEDLQIEIGEFSSDLATDILLNYGYSIMVLPE
ncbi:hypothetical protein MHK_003907 [Candidatus Magnetomorum sp. HK-1]|nr:hypothetical protein MHK_003907 [Candidatus Magnetomorum sp. HK-1]